MYGVRKCSTFILLHVVDQSSQHQLLKRLSFFHSLIGLFVFLVLTCMSCLYILEMNPLSVVSVAIIFSHSKGCLLILLMVYFAVQKLLSLFTPHSFLFLFLFIWESERFLLWCIWKSVLPGCSSKSFIVFGITFRSLIHFDFFVCLNVWC